MSRFRVLAANPRLALGDLVCAGVSAAVLAPEHEPARWFSWRWYWDDELVDRLVAEGRLQRPEPGWVAAASGAGRGARRAPARPAR